MRDTIRQLRDHTIICGYGRLSRIAGRELRDAGVPVVIIEQNDEHALEAEDNGFLVLRGDATTDEALLEAGIERASRLVTLLPKDSDNLYVVLTSRELAPNLFIISRAEQEVGEKRLTRAGSNKIISPYRVGGQKIADGILRPYVMDFIDLAVSSSSGDLQIEEIKIPDASALVGATLQDAALRQKTNVIIAAIISKTGEMQFNPSGATVIEASSTMIGLGFKKDLAALEQLLLRIR
jgi:voltage-gated potassium channel